MSRIPSLRRAILWRFVPAGLLLIAVVTGLSFFYVSELDDELDRSVKSLSIAVSNAIGPAYAVGNQDVLRILRNALKENQGLEIVGVSMDQRDMLTGEVVEPSVLETYEHHEPVYFFPGYASPEQVGTLYVRRTFDFTLTLVRTIVATVLVVGLSVLGLLVFLTRRIVRPLLQIESAIGAYARADFRDLALPAPPRIRELVALSETVGAMDQSLQASRQRLREESELRARERFEQESRRTVVQSVFHDIKNYITKIDSPSKAIRRWVAAQEGLDEEDRAFIEKQCSVLANTASQMRENVALARPVVESGNMAESRSMAESGGTSALPARDEAVDLSAVIGRLESDYRTLFEQHAIILEVELRVPAAGALRVQGDAVVIHNCLDNLLKNAMDHFASQPLAEGAKVRIRATEAGDRIRIVVEDNGAGLPETVREAFDQERQIPSESGWGVGLMYVSKNIRQIGGEVAYAPNPTSTGSRFEFTLRGVPHGA